MNYKIFISIGIFVAILGFIFDSFETILIPEKTSPSNEFNDSESLKNYHGFYYHEIGHTPVHHTESVGSIEDNNSKAKVQFTLEISTVASRDEALDLLKTLKEKHVTAYYTPIQVHNKILYRVRKGLFDSLNAAQAAQKELLASKGIKSLTIEL